MDIVKLEAKIESARKRYQSVMIKCKDQSDKAEFFALFNDDERATKADERALEYYREAEIWEKAADALEALRDAFRLAVRAADDYNATMGASIGITITEGE